MQTTEQAPTAGTEADAIEIAGLYATGPENLPFAPGLDIRAFLLERGPARENIVVYNTGLLADEAGELRARGGVGRHYLGHWHEAMFGLPAIDGARLLFHSADRPGVGEHGGSGVSFSRRHALDEDFEVIPIPGHTAGSTAYLWDNGSQRLLFTADTIYVQHGRWRVGLLGSSDRAALISSLEQLREVEFDLLVPWATGVGEPYVVPVNAAEREARLSELIAWLGRR